MDYSWVYITCGSVDEAKDIGGKLVEARLAACCNIFPGMTSVFRWENQIQTDEEVVLIAKTRSGLTTNLTEKVKELHSYDCPCVVALPITTGNYAFLRWIGEETREPKE